MTEAQDLRSAVDALEREGKLIRVMAPVHPDYEAAAILWELAHGPAVIFHDVVGYDVPLVGNLLNTRDKLASTLDIEPQHLTDRIIAAVDNGIEPVIVDQPPCQETVQTEGIDILGSFPVPSISEHDAGRYISAGVLVARDPENGRQNLAIVRLQLQGPDRLGCNFAPTHSWQFLRQQRERGRALEVAVAIGCHPAVLAASQLLVPFDEAYAAGGLFGQGLRMAPATSVDLVVPADAEIIIEGTIAPGEQQEEGPFGEFPGSYAPARANPVMRIQAVTTRRDPWFHMIVGGRHPEHLVTGAVAREATLLQAVRAVVPSARRAVLTEGGSCRFHAVVQMEPRSPGEGKLAILAAFACQDLVKHVTVVDTDIDPTDAGQVEWAVATRMRAHEDLVVVAGAKSNPVDPMAVDRTITKLGIDATLPPGSAQRQAPIVDVPASARRAVRGRWAELLGAAAATHPLARRQE